MKMDNISKELVRRYETVNGLIQHELNYFVSSETDSLGALKSLNKIYEAVTAHNKYEIEKDWIIYIKGTSYYEKEQFESYVSTSVFENEDVWQELVITLDGFTVNEVTIPADKEDRKYKVVTYTVRRTFESEVVFAVPEDEDEDEYYDRAIDAVDVKDDWDEYDTNVEDTYVECSDMTEEAVKNSWDVWNEEVFEEG